MKRFKVLLIICFALVSLCSKTYGQNPFSINGSTTTLKLTGCENALYLLTVGRIGNPIGDMYFEFSLDGKVIMTVKLELDAENYFEYKKILELKPGTYYGEIFGRYPNGSRDRSAAGTVIVYPKDDLSNTYRKTVFNLNGNTSTQMNICENSGIVMNGTESTCGNKYRVSVLKSDEKWGGDVSTEILSYPYDGNGPSNFSIDAFCLLKGLTLTAGNYYRIKLVTIAPQATYGGEIENVWQESVKLVYILPENVTIAQERGADKVMASNAIKLLPGFKTTASGFKANISSCTSLKSGIEEDMELPLIDTVATAGGSSKQISDIGTPATMLTREDNLNASSKNVSTVEESSVLFYPQPASSELTVKTSKGDILKGVEIYDFHGVQIFNNDVNSTEVTIDLSKEKSGHYIIKATTNTKSITKEFIIEK